MNGDDLGGGCILPLAQSFVSGGLAAVVAGVGAALIDVQTHQAALLALLCGGVVAGGVWISGLRAWRRMVYTLEDFTGIDITGDGEAGEPAARQTVRVEVTEAGGRHLRLIDLPGSTDQLTALAAGLLNGATLAESTWTGTGKTFTRAEFAGLRAELIRRGLAAWNSPGTPARGVGLTVAGRAVMRQFASMAGGQPPTLSEDDTPTRAR